jgi:hypothetical protein
LAAHALAADTTVVKVLAHYANGDLSQGTGWFCDSHVLITDYHVVRSAISYEVIYADGMMRTAKLWNWNAA